MFKRQSNEGYVPLKEGVEQKTLAYGKDTLLSEFRLKKGSVVPAHAHAQEQTGYLVRGKLKLTTGEESFVALPDDSWSIPTDAVHGAEALEDSLAVEVFSPLREDYLPKNQ